MARRNQGKGKKGGGNRGGGNKGGGNKGGGGGRNKPAAQSGGGGGGRNNPASSSSPPPAKAKAQTQLNNRIQNLKRKAKADKKAGNTAGAQAKRTRIGNKQVKQARNQLASAQEAGNTKRVGRLEKRLGNLKTKRNDRRQASFDSQQNVNSAADFNFAQHSKKKVGVKELGYLKRDKGYSRDDIAAAANNSGLKIGKKAQKRLDKWSAAKERANGTPQPIPEETVTQQPPETNFISEPIQEITTGTSPSTSPDDRATVQPYPNPGVTPNPYVTPNPTISPFKPSPGITDIDDSFNDFDDSFNNDNNQEADYTQELNTNQDNDINNNITGHNNYVNNRQDNSIRNYGGDQRVFNYQGNGYGSGGSGLDSPVSAATMAGFYSPSDSPGAVAARNDRRITQAGDYAKDNMDTSHIAQGAMFMANQNKTIDPYLMDQRVQGRGQASKAQAYLMGNSIYGDLAGFNPQWRQPKSPKPTDMPTFS